MRVDEIAGPLMKLGSMALKKYGDDAAKATKKADEPEIIPPGQVSKSAADPAAELATAKKMKAFNQFKNKGTMPADTPQPTTAEIFKAAGNDPKIMQDMIKAFRRAKGLEK